MAFDDNGNPQGGYDSVERLLKELRGELSSTGGYTDTGGGSISTPIALPNTNTSRDYDLDGLGNWVESDYTPVGGTQNTDSRQHNKLNEILNRQIDDAAKVLFTYDKNGNLTNDGTLSFSYDVLNRLVQVNRVSNGQVIGNYTYDTLNRRFSKMISNGGLTGDIPNTTTVFFYQNWQVMEERYQDFYLTPARQYVWGQYIDECTQMKTIAYTGPENLPPGDYYPLQDLLYRTTALTNSSGSIVEAYDYDAYGNTLIFKTAGTGGNWWADNAVQANYGACDVLYCGYRYDPEAKQYQVRNREYNPALGRWLQRDPIGFDGGNWNLYSYVGDKPANQLDPVGLKIIWIPVDPFDPNPNRPLMPFDPNSIPPYPTPSPGACFWQKFHEFESAGKSSVGSCIFAKSMCGSTINCPLPTPPAPPPPPPASSSSCCPDSSGSRQACLKDIAKDEAHSTRDCLVLTAESCIGSFPTRPTDQLECFESYYDLCKGLHDPADEIYYIHTFWKIWECHSKCNNP